ncbi:MAG: glycosyl hydrolase family 18 protein [Lachnospiraceae bacterium]|nr:glycosyl hydrolase family 18 protein [Lachnospiraceae bacterium]
MAKKRRGGQPHPLFAGILFVIVVAAIIVVSIVVQKYRPSDTQADLFSYYEIEDADSQVVMYLDLESTDTSSILYDGDIYLTLAMAQQLDERFYYDANENILIYTTPTETIRANEGETCFTVKSSTDTGYVIVLEQNGTVYVNLKFLELYTNVTHTAWDDDENAPVRVLVWTKQHDLTVANAKQDAVVRTAATIKDDIVEEPASGSRVTVLSEADGWYYVMTENGHLGYIRTKDVGATSVVEDTASYDEAEYTSLTSDEKIHMVWHQVTNQTANDNLLNMMSGTKGINVISPTWFSLSDANGNFTSLADTDYVEDAHNLLSCEVWALIDDFGTDEDGSHWVNQVLPYTSKRTNLINQLIIAARTYGFDGINIDFEYISSSIAEDYIQFLRELSVECRNEGIVLSVDNYVPKSYNLYYDREEQGILCDYVIIMGYDEHNSSSDSAGSVASLEFVLNGILDTLEEVPAGKVINAVPFYTRVWTETPEEYAEDGDEIIEDAVNGNYVLESYAVGMDAAAELIADNNATKVWLEDLGQYYAEYTSGNSTVRIWLEDAASMTEKLKLIQEYDLAGVAGWKLGLESSDVWDLIVNYVK